MLQSLRKHKAHGAFPSIVGGDGGGGIGHPEETVLRFGVINNPAIGSPVVEYQTVLGGRSAEGDYATFGVGAGAGATLHTELEGLRRRGLDGEGCIASLNCMGGAVDNEVEGGVAGDRHAAESVIKDISDDVAELEVVDPVAVCLVEAPFDTLLLGINGVKTEHVFNEHGDRPESGPATEVGAHDVSVGAHDRMVATGAVTLPDGVGLDRMVGAIHVGEQVLGCCVGLGLMAVFLDGFGAHIGGRQPDAAAPVGAIAAIIVGVVAGNRYPRTDAPKGFWILQMRGHAGSLFRGSHFGEQGPVGSGCLDFVKGGTVLGDVVVEAVRFVPVVGVYGFFQGSILRLPFGSERIFTDAFGHAGDRKRGKALLGNRIDPE